MQKEKLLKNIVLLGILSVILIVHFNYDEQTNYTNIHNYGKETVMFDYNPIEHHNNETLVLLPSDWLLKLNNISVNRSF